MRRLCFLVALVGVAAVTPVCLREGMVAYAQAPQAATPSGAAPSAEAPPAKAGSAPPSPAIVFKSESKLVLVDSIVTDKKGNYIRDLAQKDFRIWEDNKEQEVKSFSYESATPPTGNPTKHYMVLFFDNSTMEFGDQARARDAAGKFIDANARPNRLIALVDFGGTLRITQNFTSDAERLKKVVAGVKLSSVSPNAQSPVEVASLGAPPLVSAESDFGARTMLLAVRSLAKNLAAVPGRKSLVLLTAGFPLTEEQQSELTATIDACNKANVAVYPIDVRGLVAPISRLLTPANPFPRAHLSPAVFHYSGDAEPTPHLQLVQHGTGGGGGGGAGGGGGGHGGGAGGGGTGTGGGGHGSGGGTSTGGGGHSGSGGTGSAGGGHSGTGGTGGGRPVSGVGSGGYSPMNYNQNPNFQPRTIVPPILESTTTNQQVLYALADGTGGFVIHDTNDLLKGMERISQEQDEYYVVGYEPTESPEGSCHTIKVKVDRGGTIVRSRSGYCKLKAVDLLAGKPIERELETHAASSQPGAVTGSLATPFFFTSPNIARVSLAMEIPSTSIKFEKTKGKFRADMNVLGIASKSDGTVAARFSDTVHLEFEKKELQAFNEKPFQYENQFDVASGSYTLKVVFSSGGESFGKLEAPLTIDSYDGKHFFVSGLALSKEVHAVSQLAEGLDADLVAGYTPLVTGGIEMVPAADYHFKKSDFAGVYFEVYEPLLMAAHPPKLGVELKVVDTKTGKAEADYEVTQTESAIRVGNPVVPLGLKIPIDKLNPGSYRLELRALDSTGNSSPIRAAEFVVD